MTVSQGPVWYYVELLHNSKGEITVCYMGRKVFMQSISGQIII